LGICGWLHATWTQVQGIKEMIIKRWQKSRIMNAFISKFQVVMMKVNALIPLFTFILKVEENNDGVKIMMQILQIPLWR